MNGHPFTVTMQLTPQEKAALTKVSRDRGHSQPEWFVRALVFELLGKLPPPLAVDTPLLKPNESIILGLIASAPQTIPEICHTLRMWRQAAVPYIKVLLEDGHITEGMLRRGPARPARTYEITETGKACLEREKARQAEVQKRNELSSYQFAVRTRKPETKKADLVPDLVGTPEGAYLTALYEHGTYTDEAEMAEKHAYTEHMVAVGGLTWEEATKAILSPTPAPPEAGSGP